MRSADNRPPRTADGVHRPRGPLAIALVIAVALLALAGTTAAAAPNHAAATPSSAATLASVKAILDQYSKPVEFHAPGPPVNAKAVKGKKIFFLAVSTQLPFVQLLINGVKSGAAAAGLQVEIGDAQYQTTEAVRLVNQAVSEKVGAIVNFGYSTDSLSGPLQAAKAAGIPIINAFYGDPSVPTKAQTAQWNLKANSTYCYSCAAALVADWAIYATKLKLHAMMTWDPTAPSSAALKRGFAREIAKWCPKTCSASYVSTTGADTFALTTAAAANAVRDPATNFIFPQYDGFIAAVLPPIMAANAQNRVMVGSDNADIAQMQQMAAGTPVKVDIGSPVAWSGWAVVDQSLRAMTGMPPSPDEHLPLRVFDAVNVHKVNLKADEGTWYGPIDYRLSYKRLWGVAK